MPPRSKTLTLRAALVLGAASGVLLAISFPAPGVWPAAWLGLVPLMVAIRLAGGGAAVLASWLGGFVFFGLLLYWLGLFGWSVWALACLALSLWLLAWGLAMRWLGRLGPTARVIGAAVLWGGMEWGRGLGKFGFTWGWLGYSQSPALAVLPVARIGGTLGLSFLIVLVNAAVAELIVALVKEDRSAWSVVRTLAALGVAAGAIFGARAWVAGRPAMERTPLRVAIVQGSVGGPLKAEDVNVPLTAEERQRSREVYARLTKEAAKEHPSLVVWPESVLTGSPEKEPAVAEAVARAARSADAWLLAGGPYDEQGRVYNSAYLFAPSGNLVTRYDKVQLVPFGEYVPHRESLPFIQHYHVRDTDFSSGAVHRVLQAGTVSLGPMICFESIFPQISWELVRKGAQVLVIITNDAWFGYTSAAAQHRQIAVLRAVETNRWVVRAASTGISSFISPEGEIVSQARLFEEAVRSEEIGLAPAGASAAPPATLFAWVMLFLSIAYLIATAALPKGEAKRPRAPKRPARPRRPGRTSRP